MRILRGHIWVTLEKLSPVMATAYHTLEAYAGESIVYGYRAWHAEGPRCRMVSHLSYPENSTTGRVTVYDTLERCAEVGYSEWLQGIVRRKNTL